MMVVAFLADHRPFWVAVPSAMTLPEADAEADLLRRHGVLNTEYPSREQAEAALAQALAAEERADRLSRDRPYGENSEREQRPGGINLWTSPAPDTKAVKSHKENA